MTRHAPKSSGSTRAAFCALTLLALTSTAEADVSIAWNGPAGCEGADEVEAEIARLLPEHSDATLRASVDVTRGALWSAAVRLESEDAILGERTFEAGNCEELRGAVALLIVLALNPDAILAMADPGETDLPAEPPPEDGEVDEDVETLVVPNNESAAALGHPEERRLVDPQTETRAPETLRPSREVVERAHWGVAVRAGIDVGALPAPSPVFSLGVFHQRRRFGLGLSAFTVLPQDATTATAAHGRVALGALRASPGVHLRYRRLMLDVRGVVEIGVMAGRGRDVGGAQTGYSLWASLGLEAGASLRIGPISLGFRGDLRVPLNRPVYAFVGPLLVHQATALVGRAEFVIGLHFL